MIARRAKVVVLFVSILVSRPTAMAQTVPSGHPSPPGSSQPVFPKIYSALQPCGTVTPVPPSLEIQVFDPNVDPSGHPVALLHPVSPNPAAPDGRLLVDIPPTVIVHRYYYTGDRSFIGPKLTGGPCIVAVNHPRTGERVYVRVQMLPGHPRITYLASSIEYNFGPQSITICFGILNCAPKVEYSRGLTVAKKVENCAEQVRDTTRSLLQRTGLPQARDQMVNCATNAANSTADHVHQLCQTVTGPITSIVQMTPLPSLISSSPEDLALQARSTQLQRATNLANSQDVTIPTNR